MLILLFSFNNISSRLSEEKIVKGALRNRTSTLPHKQHSDNLGILIVVFINIFKTYILKTPVWVYMLIIYRFKIKIYHYLHDIEMPRTKIVLHI